jgi:hypothetical protein
VSAEGRDGFAHYGALIQRYSELLEGQAGMLDKQGQQLERHGMELEGIRTEMRKGFAEVCALLKSGRPGG